MPERDTQSGHSARLLRGLVWAGVVLAPIAAAVVLIGGDSSSIRFAVLLMAVSVVLIGASMLVRADPVLLRMDVEDRVAEEVDGLRRQLRAEFATAAPAGPEVDPGPPPPAHHPGGRAQVAPPAAFTPPPGRPTFVHQPEPVVLDEPEPEYHYEETGYGYDDQTTGYQQQGYQEGYQPESYQDGYQEDGYQDGYPDDGYQDPAYQDPGYQDEGYQQPAPAPVPARATGGRASVPGIVQPVSPAQSQGFAAQGTTSQGFAAQGVTSQGFAAQGFAAQGVPAGRASAAVPPAVPVARAAAVPPAVPVARAAAVPGPPIGRPVPRPRAAASVPGAMPPGPNGMMAPPPARAAVTVRPGGTQYGRPEAPDGDFGATNGYAGGDDPEMSAEYKARRHRPSANDTNVGTLDDFAGYPGYSSQENW